MDEVDTGQHGGQTGGQNGIPPEPPRSVGETLRAARDSQGLSLDEIGARTRVPLRHLEAIEAGDYQALPSSTYAVGFARAYARAVGVDEVAVARGVRGEVDRIGRRQPEYLPYEVADPSRVPSRGVAIVAAGLALGVLVLAALWFGGEWLQRPAAPDPAATVVAARPVPAPSAPPTPTGGEVVLTAQDEVWLRVYDAADTSLYIGNMKAGERFIVPAGAIDPRIDVGRPDKLAITLNGSAVPPLGTGARPIKGVGVSGAAVAARLASAPASAVAPTPQSTPTSTPTPSATPTATVPPAFASPTPAAAPTRTSRARPPRRVLTETQRANLESARELRRAETVTGRER